MYSEIPSEMVSELSSFYSSSTALYSSRYSKNYHYFKHRAKNVNRLLFITDFDHTLTTMTSHQCHDPVGFNPFYKESVREGFREILTKPMPSWGEPTDAIIALQCERSSLLLLVVLTNMDRLMVAGDTRLYCGTCCCRL